MLTGASARGGGDIAFGSPRWFAVPGTWPDDLVVDDVATAGTDCEDMAGVVVLNDLNAASCEAIITADCRSSGSLSFWGTFEAYFCLSFRKESFDGLFDSWDGFLILKDFRGSGWS